MTDDIEWLVVGNTIEDFSENEFELWYSPADRFAVSVRPPGEDWIGPIRPGEFVENRQLPDGSFVSAQTADESLSVNIAASIDGSEVQAFVNFIEK